MQGFNMGRYVPPEHEGVVSSNTLTGTRAQKATARGVPIVRFEMPFAVWCDGCQQQAHHHQPVLIAQGIRFNAEKHRTGKKYYSTPILAFRMRHPPCGTWIEIRTDPATTSYVVVEGGRQRREYDDDADATAVGATASAGVVSGPGSLDPFQALEAGRAGAGRHLPGAADAADAADRATAFDRLERTIAHRQAAATAASAAVLRIDELAAESDRKWTDPYTANRALRKAFRAGRHAREKAQDDDAALRRRLGGLESLELLPGTDEDARYAAIVDYGRGSTDEPLARPLFDKRPDKAPLFEEDKRTDRTPSTPARHAPTTETAKRRRSIRDHLAATVRANTRRATDPFLEGWGGGAGSSNGIGRGKLGSSSPGTGPPVARLPGVKPKRGQAEETVPPLDPADDNPLPTKSAETGTEPSSSTTGASEESPAPPKKPPAAALVSYDSDSD